MHNHLESQSTQQDQELTAGARWMSLINARCPEADAVTQEAGFVYYAVLDLSRHVGGSSRPVILQNNLSEGLLTSILNSGDMLGKCSSFEALRTSIKPFSWKVGYNAITGIKNKPGECPVDDLYGELLGAYDINGGYTVPIYGVDGRQFVIFYLGKNVDLQEREADIYLKSIRYFEKISGQDVRKERTEGILTFIEKRFVAMIANGYSYQEAAVELDLGLSTLSKLADNIVAKTNAATLPHAVIKLYIAGEISV